MMTTAGTQVRNTLTTHTISKLLRELVAHLRQNRTQLREEWARRITEAELLTVMPQEEIFAEATAVYDNYVEALEGGTFEALKAYARNLSERIIPRGRRDRRSHWHRAASARRAGTFVVREVPDGFRVVGAYLRRL
jgi:hypothetical protein